MPDNPPHVIATRQKADILFDTDTPLAAAGTFTPDEREVLGYDSIAILAIADQPFTITVQEACTAGGQYVVTQTLASSPVSGVEAICTRIRPCGAFMIMELDNPGATAMTSLDFCAQGIPLP